nr:MAG TPA: hypothetical protein [Inoviridae sp.]
MRKTRKKTKLGKINLSMVVHNSELLILIRKQQSMMEVVNL